MTHGIQSTAGRWLLHGGPGDLVPMTGTPDALARYVAACRDPNNTKMHLPAPEDSWSVVPLAEVGR